MSKETEIKSKLLEELAAFLMGEDGKRLGPKEDAVVIVAEPAEPEETDEMRDAELEELAAEELAEPEDDEDNPKRRKTLKEFLASCHE